MSNNVRNLSTVFTCYILIGSVFLFVNPVSVFADPLPDPDPNITMPKVFCFRITDIRADKTDLEGDKFTFEFEVLNWSNSRASDVHISLAEPDTSGVRFTAAGVDVDGRPLIVEGVGVEDTNGNGILDPGEDTNGDGRLTDDLMPGNVNLANEFEVLTQTDTNIVWETEVFNIPVDFEMPSIIPLAFAGFFIGGIDRTDLIGLTGLGQDAVNNALPGVLGVDYTIDANGNVSPPEAIDNGFNVRDGFTFTVDDFDDGETFQLNWFLTLDGEPIGSTLGGNAFGFGVINIARADDGGALPGPIFVGNTGFQQSGLEFFDSVFVVPDPAGVGAEFGAGLTAAFLNPADNIGGAPNAQLIPDTIPPEITAALVPIDVEDDEGLFRVEFTVIDDVDGPLPGSADINGIPVANGQLVELEIDDETESELDDGILEMEAPSFELTVEATDSSGNESSVTVTPTFEVDDDDEDEDDEDDDD